MHSGAFWFWAVLLTLGLIAILLYAFIWYKPKSATSNLMEAVQQMSNNVPSYQPALNVYQANYPAPMDAGNFDAGLAPIGTTASNPSLVTANIENAYWDRDSMLPNLNHLTNLPANGPTLEELQLYLPNANVLDGASAARYFLEPPQKLIPQGQDILRPLPRIQNVSCGATPFNGSSLTTQDALLGQWAYGRVYGGTC